MATIYNLKVKLTSPFINYPTKELESIISELIKKYKNTENGLSFESIEVNAKKQTTLTSQQIINKLIKIELYRIHSDRNPTRDELSWELSNNFYAKPFKREFASPMDLDYDKEYFITNLDCDRGSPKVKLAGIDKMYDYKDFTYRMENKI